MPPFRYQAVMCMIGCFQVGSELLSSVPSGFLHENPKYCFSTSNNTETAIVSLLFRRLKFFCVSGIGNTPILKLEAHSKSQHSVYNRGPRGTPDAQRFFFLLMGQVPLCACAVRSVLWASCQWRARFRVGVDRLLSLCHHFVSSTTCRFGWSDCGTVTASNGANTT